VFRSDLTGTSSLEIVRLLNRMIKERRFNVHPKVLSCLVHLRLKTELVTRTSDSKTDSKDDAKSYTRGKAAARRAKGKATGQPYASKKGRKALKERKEIDRELQDAEAEVDKEERANTVRRRASGSLEFCLLMRSRFSANRNSQTALRSLFSNPEES
jgi:nucleolar complex protein 3